jgi:dimethylamine---corrinoid protein Co-methyltransferase
MNSYYVRMGDGYLDRMEAEEIRSEIEEGTAYAAEKGKIAPLSLDDQERLLDIFTTPVKFIGVERGSEIVLTTDGVVVTNEEEPSSGLPVSRSVGVQMWERMVCADTAELGHSDYSYKAVKAMISTEQQTMQDILINTVLPVFYGAMPNLGLYTKPDGPVDNPAELLPQGKIFEARECQEQAMEYAIKDMIYVAKHLYEAGADAINFDTTGASGDADFLAVLKTTEYLKENYPDIGIMIGMAGETLLGMHGELYYKGERLAGMQPHQQARVVESAGGTIFGPAINTKTNRSMPWNLARALTYTKACVGAVDIPVHTNVGMGVGGMPMQEIPALDAVSRVSKSMAEIGKLDGL